MHAIYSCCSLTQPHAIWNFETKVASTGRGGAGNIRSPSRAENGSPKKFTRSHPRGRVYERDLLAFIDNAYNTGMVRQVDCRHR
jgi:hypothetical protein